VLSVVVEYQSGSRRIMAAGLKGLTMGEACHNDL